MTSTPRRTRSRRNERERGTGSIYREGTGWRAQVKLLTPEHPKGKTFRKRCSTRKEAEEWLDNTVAHHRASGNVSASQRSIPVTVSVALDAWLERGRRREGESSGWSPKTYELYSGHVRYYIQPRLGHLRVDQVSRRHVQEFADWLRDAPKFKEQQRIEREQAAFEESKRLIAKAQEEGRFVRAKLRVPSEKPAEPLGVRSRESVFNTLSYFMSDSLSLGLTQVKPVDPRDKPSGRATPGREKAFTSEDVGKVMRRAEHLLYACKGENHLPNRMCGTQVLFRLMSGARPGEVRVIRLSDVSFTRDFEGKVTETVVRLNKHFESKPYEHGCGKEKNGSYPCGRRLGAHCTSRAPGGGSFAIAGLKNDNTGERVLRFDARLGNRLLTHIRALKRAGYGSESYLFGGIDSPYSKEQESRGVARFFKQAGVENHYSPNNYRHSAATMVLRSGLSPEHAQMLLGHSSVKTTRGYMTPDGSETVAPLASISDALDAVAAEEGVVMTDRTRRMLAKVMERRDARTPEQVAEESARADERQRLMEERYAREHPEAQPAMGE